MPRFFLLSIVFAAWPAFSQARHGTIVVLDFAKDQLVMAADSRSVLNEHGTSPDDSECKISIIGNQLIFATAGFSRYQRTDSADQLPSWDNAEEAQKAYVESSGKQNVQDMAKGWGDRLAENWKLFYKLRPDRVGTFGASGNGQITAGIFAEATNGTIEVATSGVRFREHVAPPVVAQTPEPADCWQPCRGDRVCALGDHLDIAAKFCAKKKSGVQVDTKLERADDHTRLATKIVELTIDAYGKSGDVGGAVDVVTLRKDGNIIWNAQKQNCGDRQHGN
jgi:hypothetical protein